MSRSRLGLSSEGLVHIPENKQTKKQTNEQTNHNTNKRTKQKKPNKTNTDKQTTDKQAKQTNCKSCQIDLLIQQLASSTATPNIFPPMMKYNHY